MAIWAKELAERSNKEQTSSCLIYVFDRASTDPGSYGRSAASGLLLDSFAWWSWLCSSIALVHLLSHCSVFQDFITYVGFMGLSFCENV